MILYALLSYLIESREFDVLQPAEEVAAVKTRIHVPLLLIRPSFSFFLLTTLSGGRHPTLADS
jgi:hypothetical protein